MRGRSFVAGLACSVAVGLGVAAPGSAEMLPDDQIARMQEWWLSGLGITAAQKAVNGGAGVTVCLIDSGVNSLHPDLVGASFSGGTDVSGQGSPDGLMALPTSDNPGHGTAMASWIVGQGHGANHGLGILGVAPKATVMSVSEGGGEPNAGGEITPAIRYCVDHGAKVINMSIGGHFDIRAVAYAQQHDVVIVNAAGNYQSAGDCAGLLDGGYGLLTVSGVANGLVHDPNTCTNQSKNQYTQGGVTIAAPSDGRLKSASEAYPLLAANANGTYDTVFGATSTATAITSGVVALVRARYPHLSAAGVIERVLLTAKKPADGQVGVNAPMGFGVVDALAAVTGQAQEVSANPLGDPTIPVKGVWAGASLQSFLKSGSSSGGASSASSASSSKSSGSLLVGVGVAALVVVGGVGAWLVSRRKRA